MNLSAIALPTRQHKRLLSPTDTPGVYDMEIDSTALGTYMTCPTAFFMYAVLGRDRGERDALNYGSHLHAVLEYYFKLDPSEHATCLPTLIELLASRFNTTPCGPGSWRNLDHAIETVKRWHAYRQQIPVWEIYEDANGKFVERGFRIPIYVFRVPTSNITLPSRLIISGDDSDVCPKVESINVYLTGKIDLVIYDRQRQKRIVDHKTTSIDGPSFWGQFEMSPQMRGYVWAAQHLLSESIPGCAINALIGRKPTKTGSAHEFTVNEFDYTPEAVNEWVLSTRQHLQTLLRSLSYNAFPQNSVNCQGKYGACDYKPVCTAPCNIRPNFLMSGMYADRTWSPLNKD